MSGIPVRAAVLLMASGGPSSPSEVPAYLASVLEGRRAPEELVRDFQERYRRIGGGSPMPKQLERLRGELAAALGMDVYLAFKHCRPTIEEAVDRLLADKHAGALALALSPYQSRMTDEDYAARARAAAAARKADIHLLPPPAWHAHPLLVDAYAVKLVQTLGSVPEELRQNTMLLFTAQSLPAGLVEDGDPYAEQLRITALSVAARAGVNEWMLAYQSPAAEPSGRRLGPSAAEIIDAAASSGAKAVVLDPIGFLAEELETLYDCDVLLKERAQEKGLEFFRVPALDDDPALVRALAAVVRASFAPLS